MSRWMGLVLLVGALSLACGGDEGGGGSDAIAPDAQDALDVPADADAKAPDLPGDPGPSDSAETDAGPDLPDTPEPVPDAVEEGADGDSGGQDLLDDDAAAEDTVGEVANFGFTIRVPQMHEFPCAQLWGDDTMKQLDSDWLCTFAYEGTEGVVYVRSTPVDCQITMSAIPIFEGAGGWISIDGQVSPLEGGVYDWGGNHHNDMLAFDWAGKHFAYYHSSFGWGWRACHSMDCLQVFAPDGTTSVLDGCTSQRLLPAVCVEVQPDGSYGPFVDDFETCPGDQQ